jgi:hypothetical protein
MLPIWAVQYPSSPEAESILHHGLAHELERHQQPELSEHSRTFRNRLARPALRWRIQMLHAQGYTPDC